jgi:parvulin-like peptidyl-prolyl isomerase
MLVTKKKISLIVLGLLLFWFFVFLPCALYFFNPFEKITTPFFEKLPYPVAIIDKKEIVSTKELSQNVQTMKNFYESEEFSSSGMRVDFSTQDGKMRLKIKEREILDKLIEDKIVEKIANRYGITVSSEEIESKFEAIKGEEKDIEVFTSEIKSLYGWDLENFKKTIVKNEVYLEKVLDYYLTKSKEEAPWKKIQEAKSKLLGDGSNFCEVVSQYSEDENRGSCGEMGWYSEKEMDPVIAKKIFEMAKGEFSEPIKSSLGIHIILVEDFREIEKEEKKIREAKLKQIFVADGGFVEWIRREKKQYPVLVISKDYKWSKERASVKFKNQKDEIKEAELRRKSEGDPVFY